MTAPTRVAAVSEWNAGAQVNDHKAQMPNVVINPGDHILVFLAIADTGALNTPDGKWTQVFTEGATEDHRLWIGYALADGSEQNDLLALGSTTNARSSVSHTRVYRGAVGVPEANTVAHGTDSAPNPTNAIPSWGAQDTEYIALTSWDGTDDITVYPSGYTDGAMERRTTSVALGTAVKASSTGNDNAGAFTLNGNALWKAITIMVRGSNLVRSFAVVI